MEDLNFLNPSQKGLPLGKCGPPLGPEPMPQLKLGSLQADTPWGMSCTDLHWLSRRNFCCRPEHKKDQVLVSGPQLCSLASAPSPSPLSPRHCHQWDHQQL